MFGLERYTQVPLANAFGMKVIAWTRNPSRERENQHGIEFTELVDLLSSSDIVSLHLLSTPETNGLIDADRLRSLKPGALLINTARSQILDEGALVALLKSGHIATAGVDVFDDEPIPSGHPFIELDNVVMTPHVAYNTPEALEAMYDTAIDNLVAYYSGKPQKVTSVSET